MRALLRRVAILVSRWPRKRSSDPKKPERTSHRHLEGRERPARQLLRRDAQRRQRPAAETQRGAALALLASLTLLVSGGVRAETGATDARFAEARTAFEAQDYSRALRLYEECLVLGLQSPAVHFNIGVAAYKSGDLERADRAFREVARTPAMAALAHYNLGLVALKRGDTRSARSWFEHAAREAGATADEKVATLAARRLDELPRTPASAPWSLYARAGAGFDDNVALRNGSIDSPGSGEEDSFAEILVAGSYSLPQSWRIDAAAGLLRYSDLDEFDQTALSVGGIRALSVDAWQVEVGGYATQLSLGGEVYERSAAAAAEALRTFDQFGTLRASARLSAVDGENDFSGLSGTRTNLGVQYEWPWQSLSFAAHMRAELNDSEEEAFASRWTELGAEARWSATPLWSIVAGTSLRRTRHPAQETVEARNDRRLAFRVEATRTLWQHAQLFVRCEHERNESPVETYDYDRTWVAASIEYWR